MAVARDIFIFIKIRYNTRQIWYRRWLTKSQRRESLGLF